MLWIKIAGILPSIFEAGEVIHLLRNLGMEYLEAVRESGMKVGVFLRSTAGGFHHLPSALGVARFGRA